jgi:ABC-type dipeptide/oligopeptide/nickel transport system ATPase component
MRRWLKEIKRDEYIEYYLRFDYIIDGKKEENKLKMEEFKNAFLTYFLGKYISKDYLIDSDENTCISNILPEYRDLATEIISNIFEREDKENNIKGLIGESICTWVCETFDSEPIAFLPVKRGNASEQGTDRWELRYEDESKIILRIWSAKCTERSPSTRAAEIRKNDFSNVEVIGILDQVTDLIQHSKVVTLTLEDIKKIRLSTLKQDSLLSFGVVMTIDWQLYEEMYGETSGRKLNLFTQPFAEYAEKIVRIVPIGGLKEYVSSFDFNLSNELGGD